MIYKNTLLLSLVLLPLLSCPPVRASDFHSPRSDALGGAGHASPLLSDAIYLNPSFAPYVQTHSLSLNYLLYNPGPGTAPAGSENYHGHNMNLSVLDGSVESLFQAGVAYTRREDTSIIHLIAAKKIIQRISLGIGAKFLFPNDGSNSRYVDGTASATAILTSWLQTSVIVDNLAQSATPYGFMREYILGTKVNIMGITLLYFDPHLFSDLSFGYELGAEFPFFRDFFLRLGNFKNSIIPYENQRGDGYGIGVGWIAPKISFDYALAYATSPIPALAHNFGVSIYF